VAPQLLDTMTVLVTYLKHNITVLLTCGPKSVADTYSLKKCNLAPSCMIGHCTSRVWRDMGTHWPISYKNVRSCDSRNTVMNTTYTGQFVTHRI